jgi:hypothetical protein
MVLVETIALMEMVVDGTVDTGVNHEEDLICSSEVFC